MDPSKIPKTYNTYTPRQGTFYVTENGRVYDAHANDAIRPQK